MSPALSLSSCSPSPLAAAARAAASYSASEEAGGEDGLTVEVAVAQEEAERAVDLVADAAVHDERAALRRLPDRCS
jgi:hypothetical protein